MEWKVPIRPDLIPVRRLSRPSLLPSRQSINACDDERDFSKLLRTIADKSRPRPISRTVRQIQQVHITNWSITDSSLSSFEDSSQTLSYHNHNNAVVTSTPVRPTHTPKQTPTQTRTPLSRSSHNSIRNSLNNSNVKSSTSLTANLANDKRSQTVSIIGDENDEMTITPITRKTRSASASAKSGSKTSCSKRAKSQIPVAIHSKINTTNKKAKQVMSCNKTVTKRVERTIRESSPHASPFTPMAINKTFARKSVLPEHLERTLYESSPHASPFTPHTINKMNAKRASKRHTMISNRTFGDDRTNTTFRYNRTFASITTQTDVNCESIDGNTSLLAANKNTSTNCILNSLSEQSLVNKNENNLQNSVSELESNDITEDTVVPNHQSVANEENISNKDNNNIVDQSDEQELHTNEQLENNEKIGIEDLSAVDSNSIDVGQHVTKDQSFLQQTSDDNSCGEQQQQEDGIVSDGHHQQEEHSDFIDDNSCGKHEQQHTEIIDDHSCGEQRQQRDSIVSDSHSSDGHEQQEDSDDNSHGEQQQKEHSDIIDSHSSGEQEEEHSDTVDSHSCGEQQEEEHSDIIDSHSSGEQQEEEHSDIIDSHSCGEQQEEEHSDIIDSHSCGEQQEEEHSDIIDSHSYGEQEEEEHSDIIDSYSCGEQEEVEHTDINENHSCGEQEKEEHSDIDDHSCREHEQQHQTDTNDDHSCGEQQRQDCVVSGDQSFDEHQQQAISDVINEKENESNVVIESQTHTNDITPQRKGTKRNRKQFDEIPSNDKTPKIIVPQTTESGETSELRRSKRARVCQLKYWCGQRPVYKRDSSGTGTEKLISVIKGSHDFTEDTFVNSAKCTKKGIRGKKRKINVFDLSIHNENMRSHANKKVRNKKGCRANGGDIDFMLFSDINWKPWKPNGISNENVEISTVSKDRKNCETLGVIKLKRFGALEAPTPAHYMMHVTVTYGVIAVTIDGVTRVANTGSYFKVNPRTRYKLENLREDNAYLMCTSIGRDDDDNDNVNGGDDSDDDRNANKR